MEKSYPFDFGDVIVRVRDFISDDLPKCLSLIRMGHDPSFSEKRFRWLHELAPLSPSSIAVCEEGNEIVGIYSVIRKTVRLGPRVFVGGRDIDPVVHPSYRGKGVFSRLLEFGLANFQGIDFFFNFANTASSAGFRKHGWKEIETLDDYVCQLGFSNPFSKEFFLWLATLARHKRRTSMECREINQEEASLLLSEPSFLKNLFPPTNRFWVERSPDYIKWRYLKHPTHDYLWFFMGDPGSGGGLAICRVDKGENRLNIIDFWGLGVEPDLDGWLSTWKKSCPGTLATVWSTIPQNSISCFITNPIQRGKGRKFLVRPFPGRDMPIQLTTPGGWFITRGDLEIS